uniref:Epsilonsarcoglycanlike [Megachile rotundata] n=1 Tax=Lepeophtheirus salmonis TaxID=72036 RepID=A0A0K2T7J1_LEPSM
MKYLFPTLHFISTLILHFSTSEPLEVLLPAQKVFRFAFSPRMFDWRDNELVVENGNSDSSSSSNSRIEYEPSLQGKPDLPNWIHYTYSEKQNLGFIYGVPPLNKSLFNIEIVATDLSTYSLGIMRLILNITDSKLFSTTHHPDGFKNVVHLKIDNLNDEDIFSSHRLRSLKSIFKKLLWPESNNDLHLVDISSSLNKGFRKPLNPSDKNGIILKLGSNANFSDKLLKLDRETGPLRKKFRICPERDFYRTSVERHFRFEGFSLDWCAFRLMSLNESSKGSSVYKTVGVMQDFDHVVEIDIFEREMEELEENFLQKSNFIVPSRSDMSERDLPSVYLTVLFGTALSFLGMITLIGIILCFNITSNSSHEDDPIIDSSEGFIESFYLVLTDCFRCYSEENSENKLQNNINYQEEPGTELHNPRSRRASSIQRQTDSLRRCALRKQIDNECHESPCGTLEDYYTDDEYVKTGSSCEPDIFKEERPYPPPYFYESNQMNESKSYLV